MPLTECTVTAKGPVWKDVKCVHCSCDYHYLLERKAQGTGIGILCIGGEETARKEAQENLTKKLKRAVDAVHCPQCGQYQPDMIPMYKKARVYKVRKYFWYAFIPCLVTIFLLPVWVLGFVLAGPITKMVVNPQKNAQARAGQPMRDPRGPYTREQFMQLVEQVRSEQQPQEDPALENAFAELEAAV